MVGSNHKSKQGPVQSRTEIAVTTHIFAAVLVGRDKFKTGVLETRGATHICMLVSDQSTNLEEGPHIEEHVTLISYMYICLMERNRFVRYTLCIPRPGVSHNPSNTPRPNHPNEYFTRLSAIVHTPTSRYHFSKRRVYAKSSPSFDT